MPPHHTYLGKPSALQHFQQQHQLHSSSCTSLSLPNTPPQAVGAQMNPFVANNFGQQRERSQTLTQYQQPDGGAFQQSQMAGRGRRPGGVTESRSGFFFPVTTKDINDGGASLAGTMSAAQQQQQMTPIQNAFSFPEPKIILSQQSTPNANATSSTNRRKLPQVPSATSILSPNSNNNSEPINQTQSPSHFGTNPLQQPPPEVRRTSSSRMLPTPPPVSPTMMTTPECEENLFSHPLVPERFRGKILSNSPSPTLCFEDRSRRPSSTGRKLPPEPVNIPSASLPPPAPNHLQRSASARTTTANTTNKASQLPPISPRTSITTSQPPSAQLSSTELSTSSSAMSRLAPDTSLTTPSTASNGHSQPLSPRATRNSMTEGSPSFVFARKFSTDICRDNLSRNGSMAHLLEQQHLLRREFTATPDSMAHSHSNNSSLSPSIEQLNCAASNKSSSDNEDPSVHGLDLSLYSPDGKSVQTPTNSTSATDIVGTTHSSSSTTIAQTATAASTNNENELRPKGLGLIYCSLQHFPVRKRLRVSVLKIEGLAGELRPDLEIQPFCRVNIVPGKQNKQQTSFVKRGRDVVFNQEFFFDGIASEDIESKSLSIEVCHQSAQKLQKDLEIGEICVPLKDLTQLHTKKEVKIIEELKHRPNSKKLGKLYITSSIDKENRLTINIIKVEDLPKFGIIGAPDVCVRITMSQGNGNPQTKSSRVLKSTCSASYNEAVMFLVSTKKNDLAATKITISVCDMARSITGDDVIGSSFLGQLAVDKSEIEQWKNTVDHIGKEYKGSHQLKQLNQTQIHVSEIPPDENDDEDYED